MNTPATYIAAVGSALPGEPVDSATLAERIGAKEEWIDLFIGTRTRHFGFDLKTGERTHTLAELAARAGAEAMDRAGIQARDVDFVVLATATPDELMPATVNRAADLLGIDQVPTYQLQSGCVGAVQALDLGRMLIGSGHGTGLVIGGELTAKHALMDRDFTDLPPVELVNYVLFGDGAGAVVLTADRQPGHYELRAVLNRLTGLGRAAGQVVQWYGLADRDSGVPAFAEDYKAIEELVPGMAAEIVLDLLDATGWAPDEVDHVLPPQLSGRMTDRITPTLGLPRAVPVNVVRETGNTANALPFLQLDRMLRESRAERVLGVSVESSKWIKAGFALELVR